MTFALSAAFAIGLASIHVLAGKLRFLAVAPRSRWLSGASGVSVAYIFVHILPELAESQAVVGKAAAGVRYIEHHVYLIALGGMITFYGLERLAMTSRAGQSEGPHSGATSPGVFWVHAVSFALYNGLIGYLLLHREERGILSLTTFFVAMATHFFVNDFGLRQHHKHRYEARGRWILAASVVAGCILGAAGEIRGVALAAFFAFLAGGVVLNVLKEELPEERESTFWAFALGALIYAGILLAM